MAKNLVITTAKSAAEQTKAQKAFYASLKKIDKLKVEVEVAKETIVYFEQQKGEKLIPAEQELAAIRAEWLRLLFRWRDNPAMPRDAVETITKTIVEVGYELISVFNYNDLITMYDECAAVDFETEKADADEAEKEAIREMFAQMGVDIEGDIDKDNLNEHIVTAQEKMKEQHEADEAAKAEREANRKKTAKQEQTAQLKAAQKKIETRSVREIYMKLAKEFHPDTEPEEDERKRKTEVMQRITAAYEANDLPELLRLQLEYEQISLDKLDELADEKLLAYNNVLKEQIKQLEGEKQMCGMQIMVNNPQLPPYQSFERPTQVDFYMRGEVRQMQLMKKEVEKDITQLLSTPNIAKKYLKRLKKEQDEENIADGVQEMLNMMFGGL